MLEVQKLESLGVLAGGIAHDFNNLLIGILGNAGLALLDLPADSPARASIERHRDREPAGRRAARQMLAYSGRGRFLIEPVELTELVRELLTCSRCRSARASILTLRPRRTSPRRRRRPAQLRQVVMNLVINAAEAIGDRGRARSRSGSSAPRGDTPSTSPTSTPRPVSAGPLRRPRGVRHRHGHGRGDAGRIFDPFFTTKFTGRGLGLAAVLGIVRGHRGRCACTARSGAGRTFRVVLPLARRRRGAEPRRPPSAWRGAGTRPRRRRRRDGPQRRAPPARVFGLTVHARRRTAREALERAQRRTATASTPCSST